MLLAGLYGLRRSPIIIGLTGSSRRLAADYLGQAVADRGGRSLRSCLSLLHWAHRSENLEFGLELAARSYCSIEALPQATVYATSSCTLV